MKKLFGKKATYENTEVELNVSVARKRRKKWFWMFFWISFAVVLIWTTIISSYCNINNEKGILNHAIPAISDFFTYGFSGFKPIGQYTLYTYGWVLVFFLLLMALLYLDDVRHSHDLDGVEQGSAKFNNNIKGFATAFAEPDPEGNAILSRNVSMSMDTRKTMRNLNNLVVGGAGTGKSRFVVKPNILQANCNMVITDPSGELVESTGTYLEKKGYKIKIFNLVEMDKSYCYNPFRYIRDEAGVLMMIDCLIKNTTPPDQKGEKFWEDAEKSLLLALCFFLWQHMPVEEQNFNTVMKLLRMSEVDENDPDAESPLDLIFLKPRPRKMRRTHPKDIRINGNSVGDGNAEQRTIDPSIKAYLEKITDKSGVNVKNNKWKSLEELFPDGTDIAVNQYKTFKKGAGKTAKSILISCMVRLAAFNIPQVQRLTDKDTIDLSSISGIEKDNEKQALFVIIPAADSTYNFLVSMMYSQLFETLYFLAETKCDGKVLPRDVRFLLDEFSNIGTIPEYPKKLATMRKYRISCTIILQNLAQIKSLYEDDWETLVGNCDTLTYLGSNEYTTLEYISNLLGEQTIITRDRSMAPNRKGGNSQSYKSTSRKLMTPDELRNIPNKNCVIIIRGHDPFYDLKYDYLQHPRYQETGDYEKKNRYYLHAMSAQIDIEDVKVEAQMIRSVKAQTIEKSSPEEITEQNTNWFDYPNIYVMMKAVVFVNDKAVKVNIPVKVEKDEPEEDISDIEVINDSEKSKKDNESFEDTVVEEDTNKIPLFSEVFGIDTGESTSTIEPSDQIPEIDVIPENTRVIGDYVIDEQTGQVIGSVPKNDKQDNDSGNEEIPKENKGTLENPKMSEKPGTGYWDDEVIG